MDRASARPWALSRTDAVFDPGFLALLSEHVRSVWSLELLVLLRREPDRWWRADELVRELRSSKGVVAGNLVRFESGGLVVREDDGRYRFAPAALVLQDFCDRLAQAYETHPVSVIKLIASQGRLQGLADAFKFRGDDS
jgi:hypothetical protein